MIGAVEGLNGAKVVVVTVPGCVVDVEGFVVVVVEPPMVVDVVEPDGVVVGTTGTVTGVVVGVEIGTVVDVEVGVTTVITSNSERPMIFPRSGPAPGPPRPEAAIVLLPTFAGMGPKEMGPPFENVVMVIVGPVPTETENATQPLESALPNPGPTTLPLTLNVMGVPGWNPQIYEVLVP